MIARLKNGYKKFINNFDMFPGKLHLEDEIIESHSKIRDICTGLIFTIIIISYISSQINEVKKGRDSAQTTILEYF